MKFGKVFFLLIITFLLTTSNLHSQAEQLNKVLRSNFKDSFLSLEGNLDKGVFEKESFENQLNKIIYTQNFDSTTIIDSIIMNPVNGSKVKYSYVYDSKGNKTLELLEDWSGNQWIRSYREVYTYDSNGNNIYIYSNIGMRTNG